MGHPQWKTPWQGGHQTGIRVTNDQGIALSGSVGLGHRTIVFSITNLPLDVVQCE